MTAWKARKDTARAEQQIVEQEHRSVEFAKRLARLEAQVELAERKARRRKGER